jgi:uncharacterized protein (DUF58 family)
MSRLRHAPSYPPPLEQLSLRIPEGAGTPQLPSVLFTELGLLALLVFAGFALYGSLRNSVFFLMLGLIGWIGLLLRWLQFRVDIERCLASQHLEIMWLLQHGSYRAQDTSEIAISLHLRTSALRLESLSLRHSAYLRSSKEPAPLLPLLLTPEAPQIFRFGLHTPVMGTFPLYGVEISLSDRLKLFHVQRYLRHSQSLRVMPRLPLAPLQRKGHATKPLRAVTNGLPQKRPGSGSELHDIREYRPGDPRRSIVWKQSLRLRKLLCRDFESEMPMTAYILLDIGQSMREGQLGQRRLDHNTQIAIGFAKAALEQQDRVGLISFDGEIYEHTPHQRGKKQLHRILNALHELHHIDAPAFTDFSLSELLSLTANHLYREGFLASPSGRDAPSSRPLLHYLWELLRVHPQLHFPTSWRSDTDLVEKVLRTTIRYLGIELPYRYHQWATQKASGLALAIDEATRTMHGGQLIIILSDLGDILNWDAILRALKRARQHRHHVIFLCPFAPWFGETQETEDTTMQILREILTLEQWTWRRRIQRMIARLGFPVLSVDPQDAPMILSERLRQLRQSGRLR